LNISDIFDVTEKMDRGVLPNHRYYEVRVKLLPEYFSPLFVFETKSQVQIYFMMVKMKLAINPYLIDTHTIEQDRHFPKDLYPQYLAEKAVV